MLNSTCLQESFSNGTCKLHTAKKNATPSGKQTKAKPAASLRHLSEYAMEKLQAAGVSPQLLQQIQAAPQSTLPGPPASMGIPEGASASMGTSKGSLASVGASKGSSALVGAPKGSSSTKSSSHALFRKNAHLLKRRQEEILKRITCLEGDQAQSSEGESADSDMEAGLHWRILAPRLQVANVAQVHLTASHKTLVLS